MKKGLFFLLPVVLLVAQWFFLTSETKGVYTVHRSGGAAAVGGFDRTGGPLSGGNTCTACHSGGAGTTTIAVQVLNGATPVTQYTPGQTYTVTATVTNGSLAQFGFQLVALKGANVQAGTFGTPSTLNSQISTLGTIKYFEHNGASSTGVFTTTWTAPASGSGNVTFYAEGLAVNGTGNITGDKASAPISVTLTELVQTTINYTNTNYCSNGTDPTPSQTGTSGGTYSSSAGLILSPTTGTIDLSASTPGPYTVTYTYATGTTTDNVNIRPTYSLSNTASICDGDSILLAGAYRKTAGTYTANLTTTFGCDSTVATTLTVKSSPYISTATTICPGDSTLFEGTYYKVAGTYSHTYQTTLGCDSVRILNLSLTPLDLTVAISGTALTSNQTGAQYQWINCTTNQAIPSATGISYTPSASGIYAVVVTNGSCSDTSACFNFSGAGLGELTTNAFSLQNDEAGNRYVLVFPDQLLHQVEVYDMQGKRVFVGESYAGTIAVPKTNLNAIYAICVQTNNEVFVVKVIM